MANFFSLNIFYVRHKYQLYHFWIVGCAHCNNLTTNRTDSELVSVCVSTGWCGDERGAGWLMTTTTRVHGPKGGVWVRWRGWPGAAGRPGTASHNCSGSEARRVCGPASLGVLNPQNQTAVGLSARPETTNGRCTVHSDTNMWPVPGKIEVEMSKFSNMYYFIFTFSIKIPSKYDLLESDKITELTAVWKAIVSRSDLEKNQVKVFWRF